MSKTNQPAFKLHQINLGDVLVFDTSHTFEKGIRCDVNMNEYRVYRPAFELRVEEVTMNGANSFIVTGPVVNYIHGDGAYFTPEETAAYQANEVARCKKLNCGESMKDLFISEVYRPQINLSHAIRRTSMGKSDAHPIAKPIDGNYYSFHTVVFNEAVRYFNGRVPTNLDTNYLCYLLRRQERKYPWGYAPEKWRVLYNVRKFREAFRRNVNRALMDTKDLESVSDWREAEWNELDMDDMYDQDMAARNQEREDIRRAFSELAHRWEIFAKVDSRDIRFDRVTHPKDDHASGMSGRDIFNLAYRDIRNRFHAERAAEKEKLDKQGSCDDDVCDKDHGDCC